MSGQIERKLINSQMASRPFQSQSAGRNPSLDEGLKRQAGANAVRRFQARLLVTREAAGSPASSLPPVLHENKDMCSHTDFLPFPR